MKRTPLARGTKTLKRSGFKTKPQNALGRKKSLKANLLGTSPVLDPQTANIKKTRKKKSQLSKLKAELWQLCRNIQIKRYGSDCYTCPSKDLQGSSRHLGHFISSSICSTELRYSLDNLRVQCYSCNIHKSGNWLAYETHLIADGINVQELKDRNEKTKGQMYRDDFYIQKIAEYTTILESL